MKYFISGILLCCGLLSAIKAQERYSSAFRIQQMEKRLNAEERQMLQKIYAPQVVGVPVSDARAYVCVMPDGEIRCYGKAYQTESQPQGENVYLSSTDCGLSWKMHFAKGTMGAATFFPEWDLWVKCAPPDENRKGTFVMTSRIGPDDETPDYIKISDSCFVNTFLPQKMEGSSRARGHQRGRRSPLDRCTGTLPQRHPQPGGLPLFRFSADITGQKRASVSSHRTAFPQGTGRPRTE